MSTPTLRPYQVGAIEGARHELRRGARSVLLVCPTGGGKTVIASEIICSAAARGSRTLFLAHRRELIQQTVVKLTQFGVAPGVIQAGFPLALHRQAQVASVQTLIRRPGQLSQVDLVFIDEAHHLTASNTYAKLLSWWPEAKVVGLTATPWRLDGKGLGDVFASHVVAATPRQLRDEGFLVPVGGWEYEAIDTDSARVKAGDYVAKDLEKSATSKRVIGDVVSEYVMHGEGARAVVFAVSINHSQLLVDAFRDAGVVAEHVDGEMPSAERDAVLRRFREGGTRVVSNVGVLTEGWDVPEAEVCILARPTLSTSLYLQMVGRVLRPAAGKRLARIHDHAGCLAAHGHPFADRDYSPMLTATVKKDKGSQRARPKHCPACKSLLARWPCDGCGHTPTPQDLQLELEVAEAARRRAIEADGRAAAKKTETDGERRQKWEQRYFWDSDYSQRKAFFERMVLKHGPTKGSWVYRWVSGGVERPKSEWVREAEQAIRGRAPA
jgi:DNA repair protein RadD